MSKLYSSGSFPIGLVPVATFDSARLQLEAGDTLLLYTDGVTEAEDVGNNQFQEERLMELLGQQKDASLETLRERILSDIERFTEGASQFDDITLMAVRYSGPAENDGKPA